MAIKKEVQKATPANNIDAILAERGQEYGKFISHASITQDLKTSLRFHAHTHQKEMEVDQLEAIDMICHKLGRIVNGNPNNIDSWDDIAGYAKLVSDRLRGEIK
jgi:hypothetical protein